MIYSGGQLYAYCKYLTLSVPFGGDPEDIWTGTDKEWEQAQELELDLEVSGRTVKWRREHWENI